MAENELATRLDSLANLPALERESAEVIDPGESQRADEGEGKSVAEVLVRGVEERRAREERELEETADPKAPARRKAEPQPIKKYKWEGKEYSLAELEAAGLLEKALTTAQQFPHLQQKYTEALEKGVAAPAKKPEPPAPKPITNLDIARNYDTVARELVSALVAEKLIEEDMAEAYPRGVLTMVGQLRFAFDLLFKQQALVAEVVTAMNRDIQRRNSDAVASALNSKLDELVDSRAEDGEHNPFKHLNDLKVRKDFVAWLRKLNPETTTVLGEQGAAVLGELWTAFHAQAILEAAKVTGNGKAKVEDRRNLRGETSGARANGSRGAQPKGLGEALDELGGLPPT